MCIHKMQADRHLRHLQFMRLRLDLKHHLIPATPLLNLPPQQATKQDPGHGQGQAQGHDQDQNHSCQTPSGSPGPAPWLAVGKHVCGAATDFMLRGCCMHRSSSSASASASASTPVASLLHPLQPASAQASSTPVESSVTAPEAVGKSGWTAGAASDPVLLALLGLAVSPCCHHRCAWRPYVGKPLMRQLGFSAHEFELLSWMTGEQQAKRTSLLCTGLRKLFGLHCTWLFSAFAACPHA